MPKNSFYYPELPKNNYPETYTVFCYNPETGENISLNQEQLKNLTNPSEVKVVNQGEIYQSWKIGVDNAPYGPTESSDNMAGRLRGDFPKVVMLLEHNRSGTISFLIRKDILQTYKLTHPIYISCESITDNESRVWSDYQNKIEVRLMELFCQTPIISENFQQLRKELVEHIYSKHYQNLSNWLSIGYENTTNIELSINGSYDCGGSRVVWGCNGWITIKNQKLDYNKFKIGFSGEPEIKLLVLNLDRLRQVENMANSRGIEEAKNFMDSQ